MFNALYRFSVGMAIVAGCGAALSAQSNSLTISPSQVVFCGQPGQAVSGIPVSISTSSVPVTFVATSVTSDGNWLNVEPSFLTVPPGPASQLLLGINGGLIPLAVGNYNGQVVLGSLDGAK